MNYCCGQSSAIYRVPPWANPYYLFCGCWFSFHKVRKITQFIFENMEVPNGVCSQIKWKRDVSNGCTARFMRGAKISGQANPQYHLSFTNTLNLKYFSEFQNFVFQIKSRHFSNMSCICIGGLAHRTLSCFHDFILIYRKLSSCITRIPVLYPCGAALAGQRLVRYRSEAVGIGPVQDRFWHVGARPYGHEKSNDDKTTLVAFQASPLLGGGICESGKLA